MAAPAAARGPQFTDSIVLTGAAVAGLGVALGRGPHVAPLLASGQLVRVTRDSWRAPWSYFLPAPEAHFRRPAVRAIRRLGATRSARRSCRVDGVAARTGRFRAVSSESPTVVVEAKRASRRDWLLRAAFRAALILLGLLGAFALNEWQDTRARANRVDALLSAIRAELHENFARHDRSSAFNSEMADFLWNEGQKGVEFVPASAYPNGIFKGPSLTSAAWTTAQNDAALSDIPVERVLMLARVYEAQRIYVDDYNTLLNNLYVTLLESEAVGVPSRRHRTASTARRCAARLRRSRRQLRDAYRATLLELGVDAATLEPDAAAPGEAAGR